jgi:lipopolysaccharide export system protein LptA
MRSLKFRVLSVGARHALPLLVILLFCYSVIPLFAQQPANTKKIEVTHSNSIFFNSPIAPEAQRLIGDVEFEHEGMRMTCDSAWLYNKSNTLDAFSRVHIINADRSVTIDGDFAKYHGNTKFSEIWDNVVMVDSNAVLKTQHLYYDLTTNIAYYEVGAEIFNKSNVLVSLLGHYHRNINMFYFKKDVVLTTPDYVITTDTLDYNVQTEIADFVGPTNIVNTSNDSIYCERGWYNSNDSVALFRRNAWIKSGSTTVNADTLYYENLTGNGRAFSNITIVDTTNNVILKGHKGRFYRPTEWAWLTEQALLIMAGKEDSLFLHADTLRSDVDTTGFKILRAYNKVRFYSLDMQGKCDSLMVSLQDTIIHMFKRPILWAQENQMTSDKIEIETENQKPKIMKLNNRGFIVQEDPGGFNQIKAKRITGLFRDNELYQVNGFDDAETVYYLYDGPDLTGADKTKSTNIVILLEDKKATEIKYYINIEGELIPPHEFDPEELTLMGFKWHISLKPVDKNDIFEWKEEETPKK